MNAASLKLNEARLEFEVEKQLLDNAATKYDNFRKATDIEPIIQLAEQFFLGKVKTADMYTVIMTDLQPQIMNLVQKIVKQDFDRVSHKLKVQSEVIMETFDTMLDVIANTEASLHLVNHNSFMLPNIEGLSAAIIMLTQMLTTVPDLANNQNFQHLLNDILIATNGTTSLVREIGGLKTDKPLSSLRTDREVAEVIRLNLLHTNMALDSTVTSMHLILDPMLAKFQAFDPIKDTDYNYADMSIWDMKEDSLHFEDSLQYDYMETAKSRRTRTLNRLTAPLKIER
jgi:hypothetical protein